MQQPMAKAIKGYFGKRAARVLMKFIPGLNIVSTALDVYDIATVVVPALANFLDNFWDEINKLPDPIEVDDRVRDFFEFIGHEDKLGHMTQGLADKYQVFFKSFNETSYQDFKTKLDKLQGKVVSKSIEDYLDSLIEKKADFAEEMGSDDNVIDRETVRAEYVNGTVVINDGNSTLIASKKVTIPSTGKDASVTFEYNITKIEKGKYYLENTKDVEFKHQGISRIFPKGEKAIYEVVFKDDKKIERWEILSY